MTTLKVGETSLIPIKDVKINHHRSVDIFHTKEAELMHSINMIGVINPIIITSNYELVDGLRRIKLAQTLGMKEIIAYCCGSKENPVFPELDSFGLRK